MRKFSPFFSPRMKNTILPDYIASISNAKTANEYVSYACLICDYLEKDFLEITHDDAQNYFAYLITKYNMQSLSRKTINVRLFGCNKLARFIIDNNYDDSFSNPFTRIRKFSIDDNVSPIHVISMEELDIIMTTASRDEMLYLILALASRCAFTVTEITRIRYEYIEKIDDITYICFPPKNDLAKEDIRRLPEDVNVLMSRYLDHFFGDNSTGPIFYNKHGRPLTIHNIDVYFSKLMDETGIKRRYTMKDLRTRAIIDLKNAGLLNDTIAKYTGLSEERVKMYNRAASIAQRCPADLVSYRLNTQDISGHMSSVRSIH